MIARLLEMEICGFRCFPDEISVPLDADVVLIQGPNGTGKTCLVSALEFALTGQVQELSKFERDYPRCLKHFSSNEPARAAVRFRTSDNVERSSVHETDSSPGDSTFFAMSRDDLQFFRDRCYLSQSSLGRLLESYQAYTKEDPEQPLVRFVRELLGLDLLENLTAGLHDAGNVLRIEKSVPALAQARSDEVSAARKLQELGSDLTLRRAEWEQAVTALQTAVAELGDPIPGEPWTPEGVAKRAEVHMRAYQSHAFASSLQQLRHAEGTLQRSLGILVPDPPSASTETLRTGLEAAVEREREFERSAAPVFERADALLVRLGRTPPTSEDFSVRVESTRTFFSTIKGRLKVQAEALAHASADLARLQASHDSLAQQLAQPEPSVTASAAAAQRWTSVLASVLEYVNGDDCPVCGRDYSQLGHGDLRSHITDELTRIGADLQRVAEVTQRRERLAAEYAMVGNRLRALQAQVRVETDRQATENVGGSDLNTIEQELNELAQRSSEWQQRHAAVAALRTQLAAIEARSLQLVQAANDVEQLAQTLQLPQEVRKDQPRDFAVAAAEYIKSRADGLEKQADGASRLRDTLERAKGAAAAWQRIQREIDNSTKQLKNAQDLQVRLNRQITRARDLTRAATKAKTRLLNQIFNERLNALWYDLYCRLVTDGRFHPRLAEPTSVRGLIRTSIEGCRDGIEAFRQFAAVASSGNLNTAALSLFLSLHLIEPPRHLFLVLDDPVQAMDDVHVVQLANLLREIRRQAHRQLILAVHERALFEYLRLELGPTDPQTSLLTIELHIAKKDSAPGLTTQVHRWKQDKVKFGVHNAG